LFVRIRCLPARIQLPPLQVRSFNHSVPAVIFAAMLSSGMDVTLLLITQLVISILLKVFLSAQFVFVSVMIPVQVYAIRAQVQALALAVLG